MYPLISIADEILRLSKAEGRHLTPLQLMKQSYISFGWYTANLERQLFPERIEAWRYGPVMPTLYHATKAWGRKPVPFERIGERSRLNDNDAVDFLQLALNVYGQMSGTKLSHLTHREGSPWHHVYRECGIGSEIPYSLMHNHYKRLLDAASSGSTN